MARTSSGPSPRSTSAASRTSRALPTQRPWGALMSLTIHRTRRPQGSARPAIVCAAATASAAEVMCDPEPVVTCSAIAPAPPAMARAMTEAATRPAAGVVPVASRRASRRRPAGVRREVCEMTAIPTSRTWRTNRASGRSASNPAIDSSLSMAPPAWPSPRPAMVATRTPSAAARGAATRGAVSPTPPVDWTSPVGPRAPSSSRSPDAIRARASASTCSRPRPVRQPAMHQAAMRLSSLVRSIQERTNDSTLAASTGSPRRVRSITSRGASSSAMNGRHSTPAATRRGNRPAREPGGSLLGCPACCVP